MCQMKENIHTSSSSCLPQFLFPFSSLPFYSCVSSPFSPWGNGFQSRLLSLAHRQCKDQTPATGQGLWVHSLCQGLPNTYKPPKPPLWSSVSLQPRKPKALTEPTLLAFIPTAPRAFLHHLLWAG